MWLLHGFHFSGFGSVNQELEPNLFHFVDLPLCQHLI
jgi:hypothetical protein